MNIFEQYITRSVLALKNRTLSVCHQLKSYFATKLFFLSLSLQSPLLLKISFKLGFDHRLPSSQVPSYLERAIKSPLDRPTLIRELNFYHSAIYRSTDLSPISLGGIALFEAIRLENLDLVNILLQQGVQVPLAEKFFSLNHTNPELRFRLKELFEHYWLTPLTNYTTIWITLFCVDALKQNQSVGANKMINQLLSRPLILKFIFTERIASAPCTDYSRVMLSLGFKHFIDWSSGLPPSYNTAIASLLSENYQPVIDDIVRSNNKKLLHFTRKSSYPVVNQMHSMALTYSYRELVDVSDPRDEFFSSFYQAIITNLRIDLEKKLSSEHFTLAGQQDLLTEMIKHLEVPDLNRLSQALESGTFTDRSLFFNVEKKSPRKGNRIQPQTRSNLYPMTP